MRGSRAVFHLGTFSYHPYIILHFGFGYENETRFYVSVVFYCPFTYLRGCEGEYIIFLGTFILAQHSAGILFKYGRCS